MSMLAMLEHRAAQGRKVCAGALRSDDPSVMESLLEPRHSAVRLTMTLLRARLRSSNVDKDSSHTRQAPVAYPPAGAHALLHRAVDDYTSDSVV
jgi:hypothetical protein